MLEHHYLRRSRLYVDGSDVILSYTQLILAFLSKLSASETLAAPLSLQFDTSPMVNCSQNGDTRQQQPTHSSPVGNEVVVVSAAVIEIRGWSAPDVSKLFKCRSVQSYLQLPSPLLAWCPVRISCGADSPVSESFEVEVNNNYTHHRLGMRKGLKRTPFRGRRAQAELGFGSGLNVSESPRVSYDTAILTPAWDCPDDAVACR